MQEIADSELLRQYAVEGSEPAFAALVARHLNLVYSAAFRKTGNPHMAEEIAQAVFIILAKKAAALPKKTILPGWLYQTARLTAANFLRNEIRRTRREQEAYMQSLSNEPDVWPQIVPLLDDAMGRLNEKERNAIVLRFFENKSFQEIGIAARATENAAKKRVAHALEKLRKFFSKKGVVLTTAIIAGAISANSVQAAPPTLAATISTIAAAKGAAASSSILTLTHGALKIMAWTKTKTAIITAAAILLTAGGTGVATIKVIHLIRVANYPDLQGDWEGVMPLGGSGIRKGDATQTRIVMKLSKAHWHYTGTIETIDIERTNLPVSDVVYDFPNIQLIVNPMRNMVYQGKVVNNARRMNLNGLVFRRTPSPPAPYTPLTEDDFAPQPDSPLQGYWKGAILLKPGKFPDGLGDRQLGNWNGEAMDSSNALPVNLKIAGQPDETYRAELDSPLQGADGQPATVTYNNGAVKLTVTSNAGMFRGTLDASGQLSGTWIQAGQSAPAFFKRADYQNEVVQEQLADYTYNSDSDLQGHWKGSWDILVRTNKIIIPMELDIAKMPDGTYSATLANLDQLGCESPIPTSDFDYSAPNLHADWKWEGGAYDGRLNNGKITGTWQQGGGEFPLVFERQR